eukprot:TRINITY_DN3765_c0_g1_i1.p1 TRINITY_DN3765_c0_g1~~TRINITY_DN3765_c0_g1_i1.p1  ORF type:complete len:420 (-),score=77.35 TRINITY_DN3765_c0_g1_i1:278-1537(-)
MEAAQSNYEPPVECPLLRELSSTNVWNSVCSFLSKDGKPEELMVPQLLVQEVMAKPKPIENQDILKGMVRADDGWLRCEDQEIIDRQKGIFLDVLKKLASLLADGKPVVSLSLPVRIFEARSALERICDLWSFFPSYLPRAAAANSPQERLKLVVTAAVAGLHLSSSQWKPFNPLLGETFNGYFPDGTAIYCEHTSHHPPITNFLVIGENFKFSGRYEYVGNLSTNTLSTRQVGPNIIEFKDGGRVTYYLPEVKIKGILMGSRKIKWSGAFVFDDPANNLSAVLKMSSQKSSFTKSAEVDIFEGKLFRSKGPRKASPLTESKAFEEEALKMADSDGVLADITGSWLKGLKIGKTVYWNATKDKPTRHLPSPEPLPSDCRFREDLLWTGAGNLAQAEAWKLALEERQRADRRLRESSGKQ